MMRKKRLLFPLIGIVLLAGLVVWQFQIQKSESLTLPSGQGLLHPSVIPTKNTQEVTVEEAGVTLSIPSNFFFNKELQMNLTKNVPYAVNFTIQNYEDNPTTVENAYQLYGNYQWDTQKMSEEEFATSEFFLDPATRELTSIAGHSAVMGISKEERPRYIVYIYRDGYILMLAANGTDMEHKNTTDAIVESIQFTN